jgi:hypothetical protein
VNSDPYTICRSPICFFVPMWLAFAGSDLSPVHLIP